MPKQNIFEIKNSHTHQYFKRKSSGFFSICRINLSQSKYCYPTNSNCMFSSSDAWNQIGRSLPQSQSQLVP